MSNGEAYDEVFINCPFDKDYKPIFEAIVFTVHDCGFLPRCAMEESEDDIRLTKIEKIIEECRYGIHDISRTEEIRYNMPFELGLFLGCKKYGRHKEKRFLILEVEEHRYEQFFSDIKGIDVKAHHNSIKESVSIVRNWLGDASKRKTIPGGKKIWDKYQVFRSELPHLCSEIGLTEKDFINELKELIGE